MSTIPHDIIEHLAGIQPTDPLHDLRLLRTTAKEQAQLSFENLFATQAVGQSAFTQEQRLLVAVFLSALNQQKEATAFYADLVPASAAAQLAVVLEQAKANITEGPYGHYPEGPLSAENEAGQEYEPSAHAKSVLGAYLAAALKHTHFLVFHLRDAKPQRLQQLIDAGWNTTDIVTLSQLVSFLSFQIRVASGLRVLAHASDRVAV